MARKKFKPEEQIPVVNKTEVSECPEQDFFAYLGKCPINTCQYHTTETSRGCLALDRKESSNKVITDIELHHYKFKNTGITQRNVNTKRKVAIGRVRNLIVLQYFIFYIEERFNEEDGLQYEPGISQRVDALVNSYPLRIKRLKFKPWMLAFVLDESILQEYMDSAVQNKNSDVNLKNMLDLVPKKLAKVQLDVQRMC